MKDVLYRYFYLCCRAEMGGTPDFRCAKHSSPVDQYICNLATRLKEGNTN